MCWIETLWFDFKYLIESLLVVPEIIRRLCLHSTLSLKLLLRRENWICVLKWFKRSSGLVHICFHLSKERISHTCTHDYVLVKEFELISKIPSDNFFIYPNVRKRFSTLLKYDLKLFGWKSCIFKCLKWRVAAKHFKIKMLPLYAHSCEFRLALFDSEILQYYLEYWIFNSSPILL